MFTAAFIHDIEIWKQHKCPLTDGQMKMCNTHTHRHTHTHTDTHTHTYTQTHTDTHIHTDTHTYTQTHTDTHTHTQTHTHRHTHIHICTHIHTRILLGWPKCSFWFSITQNIWNELFGQPNMLLTLLQYLQQH